MNRNDNTVGSVNKRLSETMFRLDIQSNSCNTEQKVFTVILCLLLFGPFIFLLPFLISGNVVAAIVGLFASWGIGILYALTRKKRIINNIFKVKSDDFNTEKIVVSDMDIFDSIDKSSILSIGVDGKIDSQFYTILYNWLNNLNLLKDGKLKVYCLNGVQFKKKYNVSGISDDSSILFILSNDLNLNDSNREQFIEQRVLFGSFLDEVLNLYNK